MPSFRLPSPTTAIALAALFFALGGSAFAVGQKTAPQARCQPGAVRGVAVVVGDPSKGMANLPPDFSTSPVLFNRRFNCAGGAVAVRRAGTGVFDVRFANNAANTALANAVADGSVAVTQNPDKSFRVTVRSVATQQGSNIPFDGPFQLVIF